MVVYDLKNQINIYYIFLYKCIIYKMPTENISSSVALKRHLARNVYNRPSAENKALFTKDVDKTGVTFSHGAYTTIKSTIVQVKEMK